VSGVAGLINVDPERSIRAEVPGLLAGEPRESGHQITRGAGFVLVPLGLDVVCGEAGPAIVVADLEAGDAEGLLASTGARTVVGAVAGIYERDGISFAKRFRGAFAIAHWLPGQRRLMVAADRFGLRRIYYSATDQGIAFSARLAGVFALPQLSTEIEPDALYAYMNFGTVPAPQTMYRMARRLEPGHVLVWDHGRVSTRPYWDVVYTETRRRNAEAAVSSQTEEAVRVALAGSEPKTTGAFLSGGTDSSTIVGLMTRLTGEPVNAFSIGFQEERYNELEYAELVARHFASLHRTHLVTPDEAFACVPELVDGFDEPFGNNSVIPTYLCARGARENGMRLLLAGDGGDEIFGGNERYKREQVFARYHRLPKAIRHGAIEPLLRTLPSGGSSILGKAQRYVARAAQPNPDRFYSSEFFVAQERHLLLSPDFLAAVRVDWPLEVARRHYRSAGAVSELNRLLHVDLKITLGDNDLLKVTRAADLAGMDVRFPMLDPPLVELMASLPVRDKVRGGKKRYLFKRAFSSLLPSAVLTKAKHGFGLPISDWLRTHGPFRDLARDALLSRQCRERGYLRADAMERLFQLHQEDRTPFYGDVIWSLLMLELWFQRGRRP
jgi:asparagine synthase (glutamine-hydrolysing)